MESNTIAHTLWAHQCGTCFGSCVEMNEPPSWILETGLHPNSPSACAALIVANKQAGKKKKTNDRISATSALLVGDLAATPDLKGSGRHGDTCRVCSEATTAAEVIRLGLALRAR